MEVVVHLIAVSFIKTTTSDTSFCSLTSIPDESVTAEKIIEDEESDSWDNVDYTNVNIPFNLKSTKFKPKKCE